VGAAGVDDDDNGPIVAEGCREPLPVQNVVSTTDQAYSMEKLYLTRIYVLMNAHTDCETSAQNVVDDIFAFLTAKHTRPDLEVVASIGDVAVLSFFIYLRSGRGALLFFFLESLRRRSGEGGGGSTSPS